MVDWLGVDVLLWFLVDLVGGLLGFLVEDVVVLIVDVMVV